MLSPADAAKLLAFLQAGLQREAFPVGHEDFELASGRLPDDRRPVRPLSGHRSTPRRAARAACQPHIPWTPPPGGVDDEHSRSRRSGVVYGHAARRRAREQLPQVGGAAVDVAADVVRVVRLQLAGPMTCRARMRSRKPGREALDLRLDRLGHVDGRAVRDVAVGPQRVCCRSGARPGRRGSAARRARTASPRGCRPRQSLRLGAAISSSVPPRWTVPARRQSGAVHGTARRARSRA